MNDENLYEPVNVADTIKLRSKQQKIVLKTMLSELDLGSNTMSNMRHGRMISADSLARIADYLNCSVDYLLGRTDDPAKGDAPARPHEGDELLDAVQGLSAENRQKAQEYIEMLLALQDRS